MCQLEESKQNGHELKVQLTALQANHKETTDQLNDKTKLAAQMKTDIANLAQQNQSMAEEVGVCLCVQWLSWEYEDK